MRRASATAIARCGEITDETLKDDARLWRAWYAAHGDETTEKFRQLQAAEDRKP